MVLDQYQEKKQEQVIKNLFSQLQETPEPYKCLDLLSQLWPLLKPPSDHQHLTRLLNSPFQLSQYTQHTSQCWICMSLSPSLHKAIPLPSTWLSQGSYTSPPQIYLSIFLDFLCCFSDFYVYSYINTLQPSFRSFSCFYIFILY